MKQIFFLMAALILVTSGFSQTRMHQLPADQQQTAVSLNVTDGSDFLPLLPPNTTVNNLKAVTEDILGATKYDRQSNKGIQPRTFLYPDGTVGAAWMRGMEESAYADRGTAYNYFNGAAWGAYPENRIESARAGWSCYAPYGPQGELIVSHRGATYPLFMYIRDTKGTGTWNEVLINGPTGYGLEFPRVMTSGPNHNIIHLLALSGPTQFGGTLYNGMDGALLYSRSSDGGVTWEIDNVQLDGITIDEYLAMELDGYSWAEPHGDTIAFVVGGHWNDTFLMTSYDNGDTWTKTIILANSQCLVPSGIETVRFACSDACMAVEMDSEGTFHVVFGRMFAKGELDGQKYYPYTDGLVYWNSNMPQLHDSLDLDTLQAHGQLIGFIPDDPNDSIHLLPKYGVGLSSMPQLVIDEDDNIFVIWSGVTLGAVSPDDFNFRHIWGTGSTDHGATWSDMVDVNASIIYINREFVYPSLSKVTSSDNLHYIYQTADQPGSGLADPEQIPVHTSNYEYRVLPKTTIIPYLAVDKKQPLTFNLSAAYPNPATDRTGMQLTLSQPADVTLHVYAVLGQEVQTISKGLLQAGIHNLTLDTQSLQGGVYFISVTANGQTQTRKLVVE